MSVEPNKTKIQLLQEIEKIQNEATYLQEQNTAYTQKIDLLQDEILRERSINEFSDNAIVIMQNNCVQFASKSFQDMIGSSDNTIEGLTFADFIVPEEVSKMVQISKWRMEGIDTLTTYPTIIICLGGNNINVEIKAKLISYNGEPAELLLIKDISERVLIEKTLEQAHLQSKLLLESISLILIGLDSVERVTDWNNAAENIFGIQYSEAFGKPLNDCNINWEWKKIIKTIAECQKGGKSVQLLDFKFQSPATQNGFLNVTITPFKDENQSNSGFLLLCEDITDRKIIEKQLLESQKMESIGLLAAGFAHEINTPAQYVGDNLLFIKDNFIDIINLINEYKKLLKIVENENAVSEYVERITTLTEDIDFDFLEKEIPAAFCQSIEGLNNISEIVKSIKEFSCPETKSITSVDINKAIYNVVAVTKNKWKQVAKVKTVLDSELPLIVCVPDEIKQVLLNIIVNAVDSISDSVSTHKTDTMGVITITSRKNGMWIEIVVSDTGKGIPGELKNRVFEPFFSTKDVGKGTGLGLSVSFSIIKKHNGELTYESDGKKRCVFTIRLPIES